MFDHVDDLDKNLVLKYFKEISSIPRGSGNEKALSNYLVNFAKERGFQIFQDKALNVIIKKPATKGYENAPTVILQGHIDMVCEKNKGIEHDFEKDPLKLRVVNDMIYATDTTLGADNGVAVAYALALMDSNDISHPSLEILLTTEEETTMFGIESVEGNLFQGKILINLDSEEEGKLLVSSAGGIDTEQILPINWDRVEKGLEAYTISIKGLKGGHSGLAIDKGRGNANKLMGRLLKELMDEFKYFIGDINGGAKVNAIPREAEATVVIKPDMIEIFRKKIDEWNNIFKMELRVSDGDVYINFDKNKNNVDKVFSKETMEKAIQSLILIPNGVQTMSMDIPGLVESSTNLGIVHTKGDEISFQSEIRSALKTLKFNVLNQSQIIANLTGSKFLTHLDYAEWPYDPNSKIRSLCMDIYKEKHGSEPEIIAAHCGIECSFLIEKIPGLDAISIGPNTYDVHTPNEHVSISSILRTWDYLLEILKKLSNE